MKYLCPRDFRRGEMEEYMEYIEEVGKYIVQADEYLKSFLFKISPLYRKEHGDNQDVTVPLFTTLHSTSESILILLLNQSIFDADVLLRTVMEGTIKYCYLMTGTDDEKKEKYIEYKIKLADIAKISDHKKAIEAVDILREFSNNSTKPFECDILSDEKLSELKEQYPKKEQDKLKQKWSYQALLRSLAKANREYEAQLGTLSTYSLTSHFCHYDWTGVSSRNAQIIEAENPNAIIFDIMHSIRILSNVLSLELFRVAEYMRGNKFDSPEVAALSMEALKFVSDLDTLNNNMLEKSLKMDV